MVCQKHQIISETFLKTIKKQQKKYIMKKVLIGRQDQQSLNKGWSDNNFQLIFKKLQYIKQNINFEMLQKIIKSVLQIRLNLNFLRELQLHNYESVDNELVKKTIRVIQKQDHKQQIAQRIISKLKKQSQWFVRLKYLIFLHKLLKKADISSSILKYQIVQLTINLTTIKRKISLSLSIQTKSDSINKKINQYIVEPYYNFLLRISNNIEGYKKCIKENQQVTLDLIQMFKIINILNQLFEFKEPIKFMLINFTHIKLIDQFIVIIYEQIERIYTKLRDSIQKMCKNSHSYQQNVHLQLKILIEEDKTIYAKLFQFHLIFQSQDFIFKKQLPRKMYIQHQNIREILQTEKLYQLKLLKKRNRSLTPCKNKSTHSISEFLSNTVYEEDTPTTILKRDKRHKRRQVSRDLSQTKKKKAWRQDDFGMVSQQEGNDRCVKKQTISEFCFRSTML